MKHPRYTPGIFPTSGTKARGPTHACLSKHLAKLCVCVPGVHPSCGVPEDLSIHLSIHLYIYTIHLYIYTSIHLYMYLSIYLFIYLSIYLSICLSLSVGISPLLQGVVKVLPDADSLDTLAASTVASGTQVTKRRENVVFCLVNK